VRSALRRQGGIPVRIRTLRFVIREFFHEVNAFFLSFGRAKQPLAKIVGWPADGSPETFLLPEPDCDLVTNVSGG
jgi:hypothetical protein